MLACRRNYEDTVRADKSPAGTGLRTRGFSLVELVIVVLIIGILTAVSVPKFADSISQFSADAAAKRIATDLNLARRHAMAVSDSQTVVFSVGASSYSLPGIKDIDHPGIDYAIDLAATGYAASLVSVDFGGNQTVVFDIYGTPDNGGTIVVQADGVQRTIVVDAATGKAAIP